MIRPYVIYIHNTFALFFAFEGINKLNVQVRIQQGKSKGEKTTNGDTIKTYRKVPFRDQMKSNVK